VQGRSGWIRSLQYSPTATVAQGSGPGLLASAAASATAPKATIGTLGVRGLSEEDMKNAKASADELTKYKSFAMTAAQGEQFGRANRLQATKITYVDSRGRPIAQAAGGTSK
jgi:hypothetical protein